MLSYHKKGPCFLSSVEPHIYSQAERWAAVPGDSEPYSGQDEYFNLWLLWSQQLFSQLHTECHPCLLDMITSLPPVTATDRGCSWNPTGPSRTKHLEGYYKSHMAKHAFHNASVKTLSDSSENLNLSLLKTQKLLCVLPWGKKKDCNFLLLILPLESSNVFKKSVDFWILQEPEDVQGTIFIYLTTLGLPRSHVSMCFHTSAFPEQHQQPKTHTAAKHTHR